MPKPNDGDDYKARWNEEFGHTLLGPCTYA